jgi:hypothetical protein
MRSIVGLAAILVCGLVPAASLSSIVPPAGPSGAAGDKTDHWAFRAVERSALPPVQNAAWLRTPIDQFILARLEGEGLAPAAEADRITLIRRLNLDLIGLPPTIEEVDAFVVDTDPRAYQKLVERLLASPHYGERWGRHWLDAARYADSDGFEKDKSRNVWFYRDYVIKAHNHDLPYDRFVIEQLAGDLLPNASQDQIVATGFLRNSMLNEEGGIDPEQFRMEAMFDRMDAIGKSVLGLTIQCAQCHSHKYDPLTQEEYYRMFAFLNNDHESQPVVYTETEAMKIASLVRQIGEMEADLQRRTPDWRERMDRWEQEVSLGVTSSGASETRDGTPPSAPGQPQWQVLELEHVGENAQRYLPRPDGSLVAQGYAPTKMIATWRANVNLHNISAIRLELLTDPNLPCGGPGRSFKGTCALTEFSVEAASAGEPDKKAKLEISGASADFEQPEAPLESNFFDKTKNKRVTGPVKYSIDGNDNTAWGIDAGPGRRNQDRKAVFQFKSPVSHSGGTVLTIHLTQNHGGWNSDDHMNNNLGRFRLSVTNADGPVSADPIPSRVRNVLAIPSHQRSAQQIGEVFSYWRTTVPEWKEANDRMDAVFGEWPAGSTALTLASREKPRGTHLLNRGDWLKPTAPVSAGVPAFLHPLPASFESTRLVFARWLVDPASPTTARVFVNRVWQAYFGHGLVSSPEDFGTQSQPPSHPELLDWLAAEFMSPEVQLQTGTAPAPCSWSMKHVHRLIVNSATYRQSSRMSSESLERDPNNRLLARGARFRVEGEIVRDIALAASGLLNPEIGGRSVMPPAPAYLFQPPASYAPFPWVDETGPEKYRRGLYTFRRRSTPFPMLQTFDVPNADFSCVRRQRSNSPLQALTSLNESIFVECAQALARRTLSDGGATDSDRVRYAFRRVLARGPTEAEANELLALLDKQRRRIADGWVNAAEIATSRNKLPTDLPAGTTPAQLAAYTVMGRVLLNLDEAITKE